MAKVGRPKSAEPRNMLVSMRLTEAEYRSLQRLALRRGLSVGELVRALALGGLAHAEGTGTSGASGGPLVLKA